jgi:hypothetical protein
MVKKPDISTWSLWLNPANHPELPKGLRFFSSVSYNKKVTIKREEKKSGKDRNMR